MKKVFAWLTAMGIGLMLSGCSFVKLTKGDTEVTYVGFYPTGNSVDARGRMVGIGDFSVSRDSEGAEGVVSAVGDAVNPVSIPGVK